jgi:hypothetical protein
MKKILLLTLFVGLGFQIYAQSPIFNGVHGNNADVATADIAIDPSTNVRVDDGANKLIFTIKINCTNNANAAAWRVEGTILIPDEVNILSFSTPNPAHATLVWGNPGNTDDRVKTGYLVFEKDKLDKKESFTIVVETSKPTKPNATSPNFAVFAYSQIPDFELCNNYWFWKEYAYCKDATIQKK